MGKRYSTITQSGLKRSLSYNPETGAFTRKRYVQGSPYNIGYPDYKGYSLINVCGGSYRAHRLAFLYMLGSTPAQVDHINHVKDDNRWVNLRAASTSMNHKNKGLQKNNKSGYHGINWHKDHKKWRVQIKSNRKMVHLGYFTVLNDAITARKEAEIKYNFHPNHGINP